MYRKRKSDLRGTAALRACVLHTCSVVKSCPALGDPTGRSPPGSSVHGILQARILEWAAISCSRGSSWPRDPTRVSCISCIGKQILYHWATWEALWGPASSPVAASLFQCLKLSLWVVYLVILHLATEHPSGTDTGFFPDTLSTFRELINEKVNK